MQPCLLPVPTYTLPDDRYAVVLNANAGRVTNRLTRAIHQVVPSDRVFLTENPEHARDVLRGCLNRRVGTVFAGGGDGTIIDAINTLKSLAGDDPMPAVGVLRLGTGNALAHWLGSGRPVRDLRRWQAGRVHRSVPVQLIQSEGTVFPFAGLGTDAAVLNDYNEIKTLSEGTWWQALARGLPGYLIAGYLKTVPNYLRRPKQMVCITNLGKPAFRIGPDGRELGPPIPTGAQLYRGPISVACCATTPLYGYGMRMFPHATNRAGRFQLRLIRMSALQMARSVPAVWKGGTPSGIFDFYVDRVRVQFEDAMPYQLGGEAKGYRRDITFSMAELPVTLVGQT
jgi:diacylglycerol kinase family enzyme